MATKNNTPEPVAADQVLAADNYASEARIDFRGEDVLDRIIALSRESNSISLIEVHPPAGMVGVPASVPALLKQGEEPGVAPLNAVFESYRTAPERRRGHAHATTLASFVDLVNRHKLPASAIFAKTGWPDPSLTGVVNYHETDGTARYGDHRVHYAFPLTEELRHWIGSNAKTMAQADFAGFIENRIADLASPEDVERALFERLFKTKFATPAEMIELSRGLQVRVAATVKNAITLQSGEAQIVFEEEHQNDKGERIIVPGLFMIQIQAFTDGEPVRIPVRLRYRAANGKITWTYLLYRWDVELRDRVKADLATAARETGLPAFEGSPEA